MSILEKPPTCKEKPPAPDQGPFGPNRLRHDALADLNQTAKDMHDRQVHHDEINHALARQAGLWHDRGVEIDAEDVLRAVRAVCPDYQPYTDVEAAKARDRVADIELATLKASALAMRQPPSSEQKPALDLILEDFRRRHEPRFRRGTAIYSDALKREVKPSEACFAADKSLLVTLAGSLACPKDKRGQPDMGALPRCFWTWSKSAWAELLKALPEEQDSAEISASAEDQFRRQVSACLFA